MRAIESQGRRPIVIGHRGAAGHAPENTPAAFEEAVRLGADAVEFDVQFSADGWPLVFHDETLQRMANVPVRVRGCPASVLECFDVGFRHGDLFRGQRIPAVSEVARIVPAPMTLHAEIKDYDPVGDDHLRRLIETVEHEGALDRTVFSSPHEEVLADLRRLRKDLRTALLIFSDVRHPSDAARRAALLGCGSVHPSVAVVDANLVGVCHRHGMAVNVFTINDRATARKLESQGVDGFFTDYPDRLGTAPSPVPLPGDPALPAATGS